MENKTSRFSWFVVLLGKLRHGGKLPLSLEERREMNRFLKENPPKNSTLDMKPIYKKKPLL